MYKPFGRLLSLFYSHVNYSVTKIAAFSFLAYYSFYSHVNYSVTKIYPLACKCNHTFYSHVNYSVTKIYTQTRSERNDFTVT